MIYRNSLRALHRIACPRNPARPLAHVKRTSSYAPAIPPPCLLGVSHQAKDSGLELPNDTDEAVIIQTPYHTRDSGLFLLIVSQQSKNSGCELPNDTDEAVIIQTPYHTGDRFFFL